jgi:hypothetical protein
MDSKVQSRASWLGELLSTRPADRPASEAAVRELYAAAGFPPPRQFCWFDSPADAACAVALLIEPNHPGLGPLLAAARQMRGQRDLIDRVTTLLQTGLSLPTLQTARAAVGSSLCSHLRYPLTAEGMLKPLLVSARIQHYREEGVSALFVIPDPSDDLHRAEQGLWGTSGVLNSQLNCPIGGSAISGSFYNEYSWSDMARDEDHAAGGETPPILRAAWKVARTAGPWWPFQHAAIFADRPTELHLNQRSLLHRGDGAAAVYRDGSRVYAWHGKAVPERWILQPETIGRAELRGFDPSFRQHVEARVARAGAAVKRRKASAMFKTALPTSADDRLRMLRDHAGGHLPLFDRYMRGECQKVWSELVALGPAVRQDPHAADALAVAYETMQRVAANVRSLAERLRGMGYRFVAPAAAHVAPTPGTIKEARRLEKRFGPLPLSLRAFYEVVGAVDFIGHHPSIAPATGSTCPDPIVVYGVEDALAELEGSDEGELSGIAIAPDDLHKANTSGGDPYEIAVPNESADGEVQNERHRLLFVDYLRLCFRFGGFPGYEGQDRGVPPELDMLRSGLPPF